MAAPGTLGGPLKSAYQIGGQWVWIDPDGKLRNYTALSHLIVAAAAEGWEFSRRVGPAAVFAPLAAAAL